MSRNDGGSAYPQIETDAAYDGERQLYSGTYSYGGMTVRQEYKKAALPFLMDGVKFPDEASRDAMARGIAKEAGRMADALLAEDREHEEKGDE